MLDFYLSEGQKEVETGFLELIRERGYQGKEGVEVHFVPMAETEKEIIKVSYSKGMEGHSHGVASIEASRRICFFRGLMTLVRKLEINGADADLEDTEEVLLKNNGSMVDCSRNSVLKISAVRKLLRDHAALGMNTFMLYTEDTYEVSGYPYFGAFRGRYTKEDLEKIQDYAELFGIEVVPCIQTLAHLQTTLRWPEMNELQDTSDILMVGSEKVYQFVEACIRSVSESFRTRRIHLGMDEAWFLGAGQYLHKNGFHTQGEIMKYHLDKIMEICRKYGLSPMIWSDMYFRILSPTGGYYDVPADADLSNAVRPPSDMSLVYWDYYNRSQEFYEGYLKLHKQLTGQVIFAGGLWIWNGVAPSYTTARKATVCALEACRKEGIQDVICTLWQDDGAETPMMASYPMLVFYAEYGYSRDVKEEKIKEIFEFITGCSYEAYLLLDEFDNISDYRADEHFDNPSKFLLYQDTMMGLFDGQVEGLGLGDHYVKLAGKFAAARKDKHIFVKKDKLMEEILSMYEALADLLAVKAELGISIRKWYLGQDRRMLEKAANEIIPESLSLLEKYIACREQVWMMESRIFGWEVLDIRLHGAGARLESAKKRILAYLDGKLDCLPELEEERIPMRAPREDDPRKLCSCNRWNYIVSASNI